MCIPASAGMPDDREHRVQFNRLLLNVRSSADTTVAELEERISLSIKDKHFLDILRQVRELLMTLETMPLTLDRLVSLLLLRALLELIKGQLR